MCRMNMATKATERIAFGSISHTPLADPYIEQIIPWQNNKWLIATKEYGLFELNNDSTIARQLSFPGNKHVFYTAFLNDLLFVSVWDNDPKIFKINNGNWQELKKDITAFTITYVLHDQPAKRYWIGTLKGLLETDENLNIINHYTRDNGLSNHYIYSMVMDHDSILWISTNRGLSQFNTKTRSFRVFTPSDGLQGYEYNAKAGFMASDGSLYFGGTNGFDMIRPAVSSSGRSLLNSISATCLSIMFPIPAKRISIIFPVCLSLTMEIILPFKRASLILPAVGLTRSGINYKISMQTGK